MDYREHLAVAMLDIGNKPDTAAAITDLIKACASCIAYLSGSLGNIDATMTILDHTSEAMRIEAAEWTRRQQGAPHGKPH